MNLEVLKKRLEESKAILEIELKKLGKRNPMNPKDWQAVAVENSDIGEDLHNQTPEDSERADRIEDFESRYAEEEILEKSYNDVIAALDRIKEGSYGYCNIGGNHHSIEEDRLTANPAALTCKMHKDE